MKKKIRIGCLLLVISIIIQASLVSAYPYPGTQPEKFEYGYSEEPLVAYNATTIPTIDGIVSEGEWNDTAEYTYERLYDSNTTSQIKCRLKHDDQWLYVLFSVEHSVGLVCEPSYLALFYSTYKDEGIYPESNKLFGAVVASSHGGAWIGIYVSDIHWGEDENSIANATVGFSCIDEKSYLYEVNVSLLYFNTTERLIPFNLEWHEFPWYEDQIGFGRVLKPGMILSDSYWIEITEVNSLNWIPYVALSVVVAVCSSGITFVYTRKKSRKG